MKYFKKIDSLAGNLTLVATDTHLVSVLWENHKPIEIAADWKQSEDHPVLRNAEAQLREYFDGRRTAFSIPTQTQGTQFQEKVWNALKLIPYGETWSYGKLAKLIGMPKASRAVGAANGKNPLSIIVPCHRVVGADGRLTGFSGGLETKAALLSHEKRN